MNCEHCRAQMLPFLYELLEAEESAALAAHVESCPDCRSSLLGAREQQGMLAEAVKEQHPDIVFKAPAKATPAPTVLMHRPMRRSLWRNRWAMAAAVLLLVAGAGGAIAVAVWRDSTLALDASLDRLARANEDLKKSRDALNQTKVQTQKEMRAIQGEIDSLLQKWKSEENRTRKVLEDKAGAQLYITGPQVPLAGAPNSYQVELRQDYANNNFAPNAAYQNSKDVPKGIEQPAPPAAMPMQVRAYNQRTNQEVFKQNINLQGNNRAQFVLPSDLAIKPGDDIIIEFQTHAEGKLVTLIDKLKLAFPEYTTHLTTDRPLYRPGETVRFRSLTLDRFSLKPAQQVFNLRYRIVGPNNETVYTQETASQVVTGPKNEPIKGPDGKDLYCFGAGEFTLPSQLASGQYTLAVNEVNDRFSEEKRTFLVNNWQSPRYKKEVKFNRDSYGPGEMVKMQFRAAPIQAGNLGANNLRIAVKVVVDDLDRDNQVFFVGKDGRTAYEYQLPPVIAKGVATVTMECQDNNGPPEKLVRSIPLAVRDVQVEFYPEGGDLVAGVSNRVYFQARTPANKPVDVAGRIVDERHQEVARVRTVSDEKELGLNQGMGAFEFTPEAKTAYWLHIDSPKGIDASIKLPEVKPQGVVLHLPQAVAENEIDVRLQTVGEPRELLVGAYCRGRMVDFVKAQAGASSRLTLKPMKGVGGVYRITVFEKAIVDNEAVFRPLAERLIYRKSAEKVDVTVTGDRTSYKPGETVSLSLDAKNEKWAFVPTMATIAVVDNSIMKLADDKAARGLPAHFLLATEVRNPEDLENADVLLSSNPKAGVALDLLLGCQGWRRFAEQDPLKFQREQKIVRGQQPQANFLSNSIIVPQVLDLEQKHLEKLDEEYVKQAIALEKKLAATEKKEAGPANLVQTVNEKGSIADQVGQEVWEAQLRLRALKAFAIQVSLGLGVLALVFFAFFCISVGLRRLSDASGHDRGWLGSGLALLGVLFLISLVGTFALRGTNDWFEDARFGGKQAVGMWTMPAPAPAKDGPFPPPIEVLPNLDDRAVASAKDANGSGNIVAVASQPLNIEPRFGVREEQGLPGMAKIAAQGDRALRHDGNYQALLQKQIGRRVQLPPLHDPSVVRVYAHQNKANDSRDRGETLYWHPVLVMPAGKADVTFDVPESATRFQVLILSNTFDGRLGTNRIEFDCKAK